MLKHKFFTRIILIVLLCGIGGIYSQYPSYFKNIEDVMAASHSKGVHKGKEALSFDLPTLAGANVSLDDYRGQLVVINFFATWCHPCQEEMPVIVELEKRLKEKDGVLLAVNLTSQEQSKEVVKSFLNHFHAMFDPLLDEKGKVMKDYQIIGIPTTIVIDQEGMIIQRINGGLTFPMMEELILNQF